MLEAETWHLDWPTMDLYRVMVLGAVIAFIVVFAANYIVWKFNLTLPKVPLPNVLITIFRYVAALTIFAVIGYTIAQYTVVHDLNVDLVCDSTIHACHQKGE